MITLRRATKAEEHALYAATFPVWGQTFTEAEYVHRELTLRAHPYGAAHLDTWVLADGEAIVASLETLRIDAVTAQGERGHGYGVASVFTPPSQRGKGLATRLLTGVLRRLEEEDPLARAAMLFSDVGARIYERCGFVALPGDDLAIPAAPWPDGAPADLVPLRRREVPPGRASAGQCSLIATPGRIDWLHERQALHASFVRRAVPASVGARLGEHTVVWTANYPKNTLDLLAMDADERHAPALIAAARALAHENGFSHLMIWDSEAVPAGALASLGHVVERRPRAGSLVMIAPLHGASIAPSAPPSHALWC